MGKASIEVCGSDITVTDFCDRRRTRPAAWEAAVASQPTPNSLGYYVVRLKMAEAERQIKMNLRDLTEAFNNLHAAITKSILLSFWEIQRKKFPQTFLSISSSGPSSPSPSTRRDWIGEKMKRKKWLVSKTSRMIAPFFREEALKYDKGAYWEARASELMSQLWRQASIVSSWQVASAMAHRDDEKRGECGPGERERRKHKKIIHFDPSSVRCFGCAFLLCADFIDYMKRIQIAAQECNIRFLNPIVGTPEKRAPQCGYIHNIL